jgi:site-specific recombinase XerD
MEGFCMLLTDAIQDYLRHIAQERGLARKTVKGYQAWLHNLHGWMQANGCPEPYLTDFNLPTLKRYYYHMAGKGYRPRTLWSVLHPLRGLGAFLVANGALAENPAMQVVLPKKDAAVRLVTTDAEIALLLDACERQRTPKQIALSRAILAVFVYCGLRRQECLDLKVGDVTLAEKSLPVRSGKGGKSRRVFLCTPALDALAEWLAVRQKDTNHDWLWAYDRSRRLHDNGLRALMETLKANAGLRDHANICPHSLRHACATRLLRNGANLKDIQTWLGHSQLTTTAQYLHSNEEQLRNVAELTALRTQKTQEEADGNVIRMPKRAAERRRLRRTAQ